MATAYGVSGGQLARIGAILLFVLWPILWQWKGKEFFREILERFYDVFVVDTDYELAEHSDILDLQSANFGVVVFWFVYITVIMIDLNLLGILGTDKTSQNIYIAGASITLGGGIIGIAVINYLMSGAKLLLTGSIGLGNFVGVFHPHGDKFYAWVRKVMLFSTQFQGIDGRLFVLTNEVLLEYRFENYDRPPFYHEVFDIEITPENKGQVVGSPPLLDPQGVVVQEGQQSLIIVRIAEEMSNFLIKTTSVDRQYYEQVFNPMNDEFWNAWKSPSITMVNQNKAQLRFPVRSYVDGITVRHEIFRRGILEIKNYKKPKEVIQNV